MLVVDQVDADTVIAQLMLYQICGEPEHSIHRLAGGQFMHCLLEPVQLAHLLPVVGAGAIPSHRGGDSEVKGGCPERLVHHSPRTAGQDTVVQVRLSWCAEEYQRAAGFGEGGRGAIGTGIDDQCAALPGVVCWSRGDRDQLVSMALEHAAQPRDQPRILRVHQHLHSDHLPRR